MAGALVDRLGAGAVIVTAGPRGAFLAGPEERNLPAPAVDAVDTTGAGDAFVGVLGAALARGAALGDAVAPAVAAASRSVTQEGSIPSYPRR
jgi:ribokinase